MLLAKSSLSLLCQRGDPRAPFGKGGRAERGGILVSDCANLVCFDLVSRLLSFNQVYLPEPPDYADADERADGGEPQAFERDQRG